MNETQSPNETSKVKEKVPLFVFGKKVIKLILECSNEHRTETIRNKRNCNQTFQIVLSNAQSNNFLYGLFDKNCFEIKE